MKNAIPELLQSYIEGTMSATQTTNIETALGVVYTNLPTRPLITQIIVDGLAKMGDRREKEAKATAKVLRTSPNVLLPPLTPAALDNTLTLNDQLYLIQLDLEEVTAYVKMLVDLTGAQGTNWAMFAKYMIDLFAKGGNADAKVLIEKLEKALKDVEQELAANKLSKSDKALLKEAKDAKKLKAAENK